MKSNAKWTLWTVLLTAFALIFLGGITVVVDPFFHYHAPLDFLEYCMKGSGERYQNDGIVKNFDYDAIITGTSMTQNFKTSEFDKLFGVNSVKVSFAGASYREINENLERAIAANKEIKYIVRALDYQFIIRDKDTMHYDSYPTYLYDDKLYNDVYYIWNKEVLFNHSLYEISYTLQGRTTPTFDEYSSWSAYYSLGEDSVLSRYHRSEKADEDLILTEKERKQIEENIKQNVISLVEENPQIEFYYYFTPYSIIYWDDMEQKGKLTRQLEAEQMAIEMLLEYDNIHLFSFYTDFEMVCDLDNYKDMTHYGEHINSQILEWMKEGEYQLTKENYIEYCETIRDFYTTYDYDALFE